jgi:hypothetical protein
MSVEQWWNDNDRGKPKNSSKSCPIATLSSTNFPWTDPGANPRLRRETPATNRSSHGTAEINIYWDKVTYIGLLLLSLLLLLSGINNENKNYVQDFGGELIRGSHLEDRGEDNIKMSLREVSSENVKWTGVQNSI